MADNAADPVLSLINGMKFFIDRVIYMYEVINCYYMKSAARSDSSYMYEYALKLSVV